MRSLPLSTPTFLLLGGTLLLFNKPLHVDGSCVVGETFQDLFLQALDEVEEKIEAEVKDKIDALGLGPFRAVILRHFRSEG